MPTRTAARRGRPQKYGEPASVVAMTLPDAVIAALRTIDADLGHAVVRLARAATAAAPLPAELSAFGDRAVILVPPSPALRDRTGVELVPLGDGRALISFDPQLTIHEIELRVNDALDDPDLPAGERTMFAELARILREARRSGRVALRERSIIVLQRLRGTARTGGPAREGGARRT
jgi:hypothetical protein